MRLLRESAISSSRAPAFIAIVTLSILGCASYPSTRRQLFFAPVLSITCYFLFFTKTSDRISDYSLGLWVTTNIFVMSDFLLLPATPSTQHCNMASHASMAKKLGIGFNAFVSPRGTGVEGIGQQQLPRANETSRRSGTRRSEVVMRQLAILAQCGGLYIAGDVAMQCNPSFETNGPPFYAQSWWLQPTILGHAVTSRALINGVYCGFAIVSVCLGLSGPDEWPPLFGSFFDARTVHGLWRNVWHQMMRRFLTRHATFLTSKLGVRGKVAQWVLKLYLAFLISAIIHYLGDYALLRNWTGGSMKFFMLQPVAITLEHVVVVVFRRTGIRIPAWILRCLGHLWVVWWFTVTLPIWVEPVVRDGFLEEGWHPPAVIMIGGVVKQHFGSS